MEKKYQETLDYLHEEAAKASPHSQHETNLLTLIDVFEELIKENQELKDAYINVNEELHCAFARGIDSARFDVLEENEKLKKALEILKEYLNIEVDIDTRTIITDVGDTSIVGATKEDVEDLMLLKEVLNDEIL